MADPLSETVTLLRPRAILTKGIGGAGAWAARYSAFGQPGFCTVTEGRCRLHVDGLDPVTLETGDFVLLPATPGFTLSGFDPATPVLIDAQAAAGSAEEIRHGCQEGDPDVRLLGGYFLFESPDAGLFVSLLPAMIHLRGVERLSQLVRMVAEEARADRPGRDLVLARLVEVVLIEALRSVPGEDAPPGLLRALGDARLAQAMRQMHADPAHPWTMAGLARHAALSRSAFFDRFVRAVGLSPMEYLLGWRMALAKDLLRRRDLALDQVAARVGYGSASTFSTAFSRHVGQPPGRYARTATA